MVYGETLNDDNVDGGCRTQFILCCVIQWHRKSSVWPTHIHFPNHWNTHVEGARGDGKFSEMVAILLSLICPLFPHIATHPGVSAEIWLTQTQCIRRIVNSKYVTYHHSSTALKPWYMEDEKWRTQIKFFQEFFFTLACNGVATWGKYIRNSLHPSQI